MVSSSRLPKRPFSPAWGLSPQTAIFGFAIPIDDARVIVARLLSTERLNGVTHGMFGSDVKTSQQKKLVISEVVAGSAAAQCGLAEGDTIRTVRGIAINDSADWERSLLDMPVGQVLDVEVVRAGKPLSLKFTVGVGNNVAGAVRAQPRVPVRTVSTSAAAAGQAPVSIRSRVNSLLGMSLQDLTPRDRHLLDRHARSDMKINGGMKIVAVRTGSPADRHGIYSGDILLGLDEFETLNDGNLEFILQDSRLRPLNSLSFHIFRESRGALVGSIDLPKIR